MGKDWEEPRDIGPQIEERPHRHKKMVGGKKPFAIERRYTGMTSMWEWHVHRRYKTEKQRDKALSNLCSKDSNWEYRRE